MRTLFGSAPRDAYFSDGSGANDCHGGKPTEIRGKYRIARLVVATRPHEATFSHPSLPFLPLPSSPPPLSLSLSVCLSLLSSLTYDKIRISPQPFVINISNFGRVSLSPFPLQSTSANDRTCYTREGLSFSLKHPPRATCQLSAQTALIRPAIMERQCKRISRR
jgi:hypothetical protein